MRACSTCSVRFRGFVLALVASMVPFALAHAQGTGGNRDANANATTSASASAPPSTTSSAAPSNDGGHSLTGYGYSDPKPTHGRGLVVRSGTRSHRPVMPVATGPVATLPGFEMLAEGGSRLFVELTQMVQVEERRARGTLTYVIHGAHVTVRNNENPLITVHFNTPVTRARLVPSGRDLLFIVDLRADVSPTWKMNPGKEGSTVLTVDFPKGSYVSGEHGQSNP